MNIFDVNIQKDIGPIQTLSWTDCWLTQTETVI